MNKLSVNTSELIQMSLQERRDFLQADEKSSPACVELFRRAFDGDEEAWSGVYKIFKPLMKGWIGIPNNIDPEDVIQDAFISFSHYAPHNFSLLATESLSPILSYLKRCVQSTLVDILRRSKGQSIADLDGLMPDELSDYNIIEQSNSIIAMRERLSELLKDYEERLIFHLRFEYNMPPREIMAQYPGTFENYQEVATIIQRLTRRLRQDPIIRELRGVSTDIRRTNMP